MAKRITDLPELPVADSTDLIPIVDISGNVTKYVSASGLAAAIAANLPIESVEGVAVDFDTASNLVVQHLTKNSLATTSAPVAGLKVKSGWGWMQPGTAINNFTRSVAFNEQFTSPPVVVLSGLGESTLADPTISDMNTASGVYFQASGITATGFDARVLQRDGSSSLSTSIKYGYSWIAIGI